MAAGYSTRTLVNELGIKPSTKIMIIHGLDDYAQTLGDLPAGTIQGRDETRTDSSKRPNSSRLLKK